MRGLRLPDPGKFMLDMAALRIEIVSLSVPVQPDALLLACSKEFTERVSTSLGHGLVERLRAAGDLAFRAVLLPALRFAVGLEAATLVEVEERAADFMRFEPIGQGANAQSVGIAFGNQFSFLRVVSGLVARDAPVVPEPLDPTGGV